MISDASKMIDVEPHVLRYWEIELGVDIPRNELGHRYYSGEHVDLLKSVKALKDKGFQLKAIKLLLPDIKKVEALEVDRLNDLRDKLEIAMGLVGIESREKEFDEETIGIEKEEEIKGEDKAMDHAMTMEHAKTGEHTKIEDISSVEVAASSQDLEIQKKSLEETDEIKDGESQFGLIKESSACVEEKEDKLGQFRNIMCSIMMGAMKENNEQLSTTISNTVTNSVIKELDYRLRVREEREEERFKQLDRTIREYQMQRQQTAATKEMNGYKRKESKFFKKNNRVKI